MKTIRAGYRDVLHTTGDSVKDRLQHEQGGVAKKNIPLLNRARTDWENQAELRRRRLRNDMYVYIDQWGDLVKDKDGNLITERQRIIDEGGVPLQNNHLIKIINTLTGIYTKSSSMPVCFARKEQASEKSNMMTNALQTNYDRNSEKEILTHAFLEMAIGGIPVVREEWNTHEGIEDSYSYYVNPSYFIWESPMGDPRMWDVNLVGEIRDYPLDELAAELATSAYDYDMLKKMYAPFMRDASGFSSVQINRQHSRRNISWDMPAGDNLCRTYQIWTRESKLRYRCVDILDKEQSVYRIDVEDLPSIEEINKQRIQTAIRNGLITADTPQDQISEIAGLIEYQQIYDQYWHFTMLSPYGDVLQECDSPYEHKSHPYVFRLHQLFNGEVIPFISSVLDQNRYINRLLLMKDMMMMSGAKGLKFIPDTMVPDDMTREEFKKQFVKIGGTFFYKPDPKTPNIKPDFYTNSFQDAGFSELLALQIQSINDITSVSEALQGKTPGNGVAASRYAMETENATTSIAYLLSKFSQFEKDVATKKMKVIHQYYNSPRHISHKRSNGYVDFSLYDPKEVQDIDFDVAIKEAPETPVARMMINDFVMSLWEKGAIGALECLDNIYLPGTEDLKASLRQQLEAVRNGQQPQQIQNNIPYNQQAVEQLQQVRA